MNEMTEEMLTRKKQLCEQTLAVLNKIDAGQSPRKGTFQDFLPAVDMCCHCYKCSELKRGQNLYQTDFIQKHW